VPALINLNKTIITLVMLCVCQISALTLKHGHSLKAAEEKVRKVRKVSGPKRCKITGDWRTFYNEELHSLYLQ